MGLCHSFFAAIASISSAVLIDAPALTSTRAAASRALIFRFAAVFCSVAFRPFGLLFFAAFGLFVAFFVGMFVSGAGSIVRPDVGRCPRAFAGVTRLPRVPGRIQLIHRFVQRFVRAGGRPGPCRIIRPILRHFARRR